MKNRRWFKPHKIIESIQEFELLEIVQNIETNKIIYFIVENKKGEQLKIAPKSQSVQLPEETKIEDFKRGVRLRVRASKRKLKSHNNMIIFSEILEINPPIQSEIEDFL